MFVSHNHLFNNYCLNSCEISVSLPPLDLNPFLWPNKIFCNFYLNYCKKSKNTLLQILKKIFYKYREYFAACLWRSDFRTRALFEVPKYIKKRRILLGGYWCPWCTKMYSSMNDRSVFLVRTTPRDFDNHDAAPGVRAWPPGGPTQLQNVVGIYIGMFQQSSTLL